MSTLQLIALLGVVIGFVAFVIEMVKKRKKAYWLYALLIISSFVLLLVASHAEKKRLADLEPVFVANQEIANQANQVNDQVVAAADPGQPNAVDDDDDGFVLGDPIDDAPENAPVEAAAPEAGDAGEAAAPEAGDAGEAAAPEAGDAGEAAAPEAADNAPVAAADPEPVAAPEPAPAAAQNDPNAPVAEAGEATSENKVNEAVAFSGKKSKAAKGSSIVSYEWDFGDGKTAKGKEVKHAYDKAGEYTATLTVTDKEGRIGTATRSVSIDRPEAKLKVATPKLANVVDVSASQAPATGTITKTFTGSKINVEVTGYVATSGECKCSMIASIHGPGCDVTKSKGFEEDEEGTTTVRATCKGELGEYTWSVERKATGSCYCTWKNMSIEVFEH